MITCWFGLIGVGLYGLWSYAQRPGDQTPYLGHWPAGGDLILDDDQATVLLFAHAKCPCTRASIRQLERILARNKESRVQVIFWVPDQPTDDWTRSSLVQSSRAIPGLKVLLDPGGKMCRHFEAQTSGLVAAYAPSGDQLFQGGITTSRGHEGDNDGSDAVAAILAGGLPVVPTTPVFGCPLTAPAAGIEKE